MGIRISGFQPEHAGSNPAGVTKFKRIHMKIKKGSRIRAVSVSYTDSHFGFNGDMEGLIEDRVILTVDQVYNGGKYINAGGWDWHYKDVELLGTNLPPIPKPQLFDIEKLDVCGSEGVVSKLAPNQ